MKRGALAICALGLAGLGLVGTSSNAVPSSTAGYKAVRVTGAKMRSISYTVAAGTITAFTVNLNGPASTTVIVGGLPVTTTLFTTVKAHFGSNPDSTCVLGAYDAVADQTPATCAGFTQSANRSWTLRVTVT